MVDREDKIGSVKSVLRCGHSKEDYKKVLFKVTSGGMSGGNCWGDSPSSFDVSELDIEDDLKLELTSYWASYCDLFPDADDALLKVETDKIVSNMMASCDYDLDTEYEYYGNFYNKRTYNVSLQDVLTAFSNAKVKKEDILEVEALFDEVISELNEDNALSVKKAKVKKLEKEIGNFELDKKKEKARLLKETDNLKKELEKKNKELLAFDDKKSKELFSLNNDLKKLKDELGEDSKKPKFKNG